MINVMLSINYKSVTIFMLGYTELNDVTPSVVILNIVILIVINMQIVILLIVLNDKFKIFYIYADCTYTESL